jgi:hypothetical protein
MSVSDMINEVRSLFDFSHLTASSEKYFKVEYDEDMTNQYKVGIVISVYTENCRYKQEFDKGEYEPFSCGELPQDFLNYSKVKELGYGFECQNDCWWIFYKTNKTK